ncbi:hypothetical protein AB0C31_50505, partial [Actinoplanes philippinensis]
MAAGVEKPLAAAGVEKPSAAAGAGKPLAAAGVVGPCVAAEVGDPGVLVGAGKPRAGAAAPGPTGWVGAPDRRDAAASEVSMRAVGVAFHDGCAGGETGSECGAARRGVYPPACAPLNGSLAGPDAPTGVTAGRTAPGFIATVTAMAPWFGGINLEDISAPRCFEIERR